MDDLNVKESQRRKFLAVMLGLVGTGLAGISAWPILRYLAPGGGEQDAGKVRIDKGQVPVGGAHLFSFNGRPAVLLQKTPGDFVALSAVCTHLGCIVKWVEADQELLCPCHGGRFSTEGAVLGGPPPVSHELYPVSLQNDQILIG
jgi:cytochrome b6-f complex iron-sulfur subunit